MIYIRLSETPPDFAEFQEKSAPYLGPHDLENTTLAYETTTIEHGNWKLVF